RTTPTRSRSESAHGAAGGTGGLRGRTARTSSTNAAADTTTITPVVTRPPIPLPPSDEGADACSPDGAGASEPPPPLGSNAEGTASVYLEMSVMIVLPGLQSKLTKKFDTLALMNTLPVGVTLAPCAPTPLTIGSDLGGPCSKRTASPATGVQV